MSNDLTADRLRGLLSYDRESGKFVSLVDIPRGRKIGEEATGYVNDQGYRVIVVDGQDYRAHRLAWLHVHGKWPEYELDHRDHDRANNRIVNLRDVPHDFNLHNRSGATVKNKVGLLGVRRARVGPRFVAQVVVKGRAKHLGTFETPELAHSAYLDAKRALTLGQ